MAELTDLLKSVETELTCKIKEIYDKKFEEHIENISSNLSDCYTKDYGKVNKMENKHNSEFTHTINKAIEYINKIEINRYVIHYMGYNSTNALGYSYRSESHYTICHILIIDNYGDCILFSYKQNTSIPYEAIKYADINKLSKYLLPNNIIDFIKQLKCIFTTPMIDEENIYLIILQHIKLIAEDYYKRLKIKNNYNIETTTIETQTEIKKEYKSVETQTELIQKSNLEYIRESNPETDKSIMNNCQSIIKDNTLTIINYNEPELNLCDFLPKLTKDIEKDGRIIKDCNYTNIEKIHIVSSDFLKITKYYQGIRYISILDCHNYKSMPHYLQQDLTYLSIDGEIKINIVPPSYL